MYMRARDVRGVGPLLQSFSDEVVRDAVASSLGDIGEGVAVPALIDALGDGEWSVRHSAALALGKIGDVRAVEPLMLLQEDENLGVRYTAALAIRMIRGEGYSGCSGGCCRVPR